MAAGLIGIAFSFWVLSDRGSGVCLLMDRVKLPWVRVRVSGSGSGVLDWGEGGEGRGRGEWEWWGMWVDEGGEKEGRRGGGGGGSGRERLRGGSREAIAALAVVDR